MENMTASEQGQDWSMDNRTKMEHGQHDSFGTRTTELDLNKENKQKLSLQHGQLCGNRADLTNQTYNTKLYLPVSSLLNTNPICADYFKPQILTFSDLLVPRTVD